MNTIIYFIEDQEALTPYIVLARHEDRFPGCRILAADSIDNAFEWCGKSDADAVFVVDSRMSSELLPEYLGKALEDSEVKIQDISDLIVNEVLTGTLGTVVLRYLKPGCRTILLTAFSKTISEIRHSHPVLDRILKDSIDVALSKTSPEALTEAIQTQLIILSRARGQRHSE